MPKEKCANPGQLFRAFGHVFPQVLVTHFPIVTHDGIGYVHVHVYTCTVKYCWSAPIRVTPKILNVGPRYIR